MNDFMVQGRDFVSTERVVEMARQAAAALEIARVTHALFDDMTRWDLLIISKKANMDRW